MIVSQNTELNAVALWRKRSSWFAIKVQTITGKTIAIWRLFALLPAWAMRAATKTLADATPNPLHPPLLAAARAIDRAFAATCYNGGGKETIQPPHLFRAGERKGVR